MPWMVVRTEPQREPIAERHVRMLGKETYLPRYRDWRSGKIKSLFPNYFFVEYDRQWSYLRTTMGALDPIFMDGSPGLVSDDPIDELQNRHDSEGLVLLDLDVGHVVTVVHGDEMVGWTGIFNGMSGMDRCVVLFNIIGSPLSKIIETKNIRAESLHLV
jgi:transcription antitermination factor NusG